MSIMDTMERKKPRARRSFTPEFKAEIVELCQQGDRSIGQVAWDFDLTETAVREWVKQAGRDAGTVSDGGLTTRGDIQIDGTGRPDSASPTATLVGYNVNEDGKIIAILSDGTQFVRGQVLLQRFSDPQALLKEGDNLYSGISAAGPLGGNASPLAQAPGTNGLGNVKEKSLELSNVDLTTEFADLMLAPMTTS
jgi:flagellar hook protein FlgE